MFPYACIHLLVCLRHHLLQLVGNGPVAYAQTVKVGHNLLALLLMSGNDALVEVGEHLLRLCRLLADSDWLLLLPEQPLEEAPFLLPWSGGEFAPFCLALLYYLRHFLGQFRMRIIALLYGSLHLQQQHLLLCQQKSDAVHILPGTYTCNGLQHGVHLHPKCMVAVNISRVPFRHGLTKKRQLRHTLVQVMYVSSPLVQFGILTSYLLSVAPLK